MSTKMQVRLFADGLVDQNRRHRRIDPAAQPQDHFFVADVFADLGDRFPGEGFHAPGALAAADVEEEVLEHGPALGGVGDFRVELHAEKLAPGVGRGREAGVRRGGRGVKPLGSLRMESPWLIQQVVFRADPFEQPRRRADGKLGEAVLAFSRAFDAAPESRRHELHAVADAQHRNTEAENAGIDLGASGLVDAGRAAGQDDAFRLKRLERRPAGCRAARSGRTRGSPARAGRSTGCTGSRSR